MGAALIPPDSSVHGDSSSIRLVRDVAPNVSLLNLRVLDGSGSGIDSAVIAGIQRAIQLKSQYSIRVTNLSYLLNKPGGDGQVGFHEEPRFIVSARCLISSASEGICIAPLTRSRMY
jgi:hypothetical protein